MSKMNNYFSIISTNKRNADDIIVTPPKIKHTDKATPKSENVVCAIIRTNDIGLFITSNLKNTDKNWVS